MNTITLTIAATPDNLIKLAQAFGDSIDDVIGADDVPSINKAGTRTDQTVSAAEIRHDERPVRPAPAAAAEKPAPQPEDPTVPKEEPAAKVVTLADLRQKGLDLTHAGKSDQLAAALDDFGAKKLSQVAEGDYAALMAKLEAAS